MADRLFSTQNQHSPHKSLHWNIAQPQYMNQAWAAKLRLRNWNPSDYEQWPLVRILVLNPHVLQRFRLVGLSLTPSNKVTLWTTSSLMIPITLAGYLLKSSWKLMFLSPYAIHSRCKIFFPNSGCKRISIAFGPIPSKDFIPTKKLTPPPASSSSRQPAKLCTKKGTIEKKMRDIFLSRTA